MKGCLVLESCANCEQSLDKSKHCLSFRCGHSYHKECTIKDDKHFFCLKCLDTSSDDILNTSNPILIKKSKLVSSHRLVEQAKELKHHMLRKFS